MDFSIPKKSRIQQLDINICREKGIYLDVLREDELHPLVSGNKWRKLKYNILRAQELCKKGIITKAGPYSNHLLAVAAASVAAGMTSIGLVRGELHSNPTLNDCRVLGMELRPVSRSVYGSSVEEICTELSIDTSAWFSVPEGGSNELGVKGCIEILGFPEAHDYDIIACSLGTGGTASGIFQSLAFHQKLYIYPALKGIDVLGMLASHSARGTDFHQVGLRTDYHFGGYARWNRELLDFMKTFYLDTGIRTDQVYTGKLFYGLLEDISKECFPTGTRILAIHTGGLQGLRGLEDGIVRSMFS